MKRCIVLLLSLAAVSCRQASERSNSLKAASESPSSIDPLSMALVPHSGSGRTDEEIIRLQKEARLGRNPAATIERLGWSYVAKARESFDSGYYKLAEQCALALSAREPHCPEALLLGGHVRNNLHRFKEAEALARELIAQRQLPADFGLLSDALMEQGKVEEALDACQKMIDLRPDLDSYARGAHLRWLKGNLKGAETLMRLAVSAASPRDPESAAWVCTRLAGYQFQSGALAEAEEHCAEALEFRADYPPALLLRGRLSLFQGKAAQACDFLHRATELNPLPEYQWALAEALHAAGQEPEAREVEASLSHSGAATDPRTYALYLATRGESNEITLRLTQAELDSRRDVFTHDARAWALASAGRLQDARTECRLALAEGTQDARLYFHAAVVARKAGWTDDAERFAEKARRYQQTLLPSERALLETVRSESASLALVNRTLR